MDFPRVYREEAGLDSVLQAAGRCNREGKRPLDESLVTVFTVQNTTPPPYMRQPAAAMKNISKRMEDITSLAAIRAYFEFYRDLYGKEDLDREKILIAFENEMLPFADLASLVFILALVTPFVRRNMFKMLIVGTLSVIIILYVGTDIAPWVTQSFTQSNIDLPKDFTAVTNMTGAVSTWIGWVAVKIGELFNMIA